MLLWSVWVDTYPRVPRPIMVLVIADDEIYPNVPRLCTVDARTELR